MIRAFIEGLRRIGGAPWLLMGTWLWMLAAAPPVRPLADGLFQEPERWWSRLASLPSGFHASYSVASLIGRMTDEPQFLMLNLALLLFLEGGIVDRLARNRTVGASGFFGACGGYLGRMVRLWILAAPVYWLLFRYTRGWLLIVFLLAVSIVIDYAKVRAVVEDRRSAFGALLAAVRFIRRHPGPVVGLYGLNALLSLVAMEAAREFGAWSSLQVAVFSGALLAGLIGVVRLQFIASQIALFQSRLAHAGYTAAPVPKWPDSPAADAIRLMD